MGDPPEVIQTPYPADLDPLHRTPRHLSLTLLDLKAKRPFSMVPERSIRPFVGGGPFMTGFYSKKIKDVRERADNLFGTILNLPRHGNGILRMSSEGSGGQGRPKVSHILSHKILKQRQMTQC